MHISIFQFRVLMFLYFYILENGSLSLEKKNYKIIKHRVETPT